MKPSELLARIDERQQNIEEKLELIYEQTVKTNGRVTTLEKWRSKLNGIWYAIFIVGGVLSFLASVIIYFVK